MNPDKREYIHCPKCNGVFVTLEPYIKDGKKLARVKNCLDKKCGYSR